MLKSKSEIEGFKSRLKQYRQAKSEDSQLNYWEWKGYAEDTGDVTDYKQQIQKDVEMQNQLYDINHTDPNTGEKSPYNNVFYDPTTPIESSYRTLIQENPDITVEQFYKGLNAGKDGKIFIPKYADGTEGIEDKYNFISKPPKDINTNSKAFNDWSLLAAAQALQRSRSSNSPSGSKYTVKQKPNISEYLPFIWSEENSIKKGYDKNQDKWFPHNSVEGGQKTIGPGIKLNGGSYKPSNKEANKGMTEDQLNSYATQLFNYNLKRVDEYLGDYNDTISPQIKMGLADIRYQVGSLANFSKLKQAIKKGDIKKIQKESKVHIEGLGQDKRRNELRKQKYFHY